MALVFNTGYLVDPISTVSTFSTFIPFCDVPVSVDGLYQSRHIQEIYYAPEPAPQIQFVRQRLPDPPPDVIERVVVVPQPRQYIYQIVEVPTKPPPIIQERVVHQQPNAPQCGGTYRVQVPHGVSAAPSPNVVRSSSNVQITSSPSNVKISSSPSYGQAAPMMIQSAPISYTSPPIITI